MDAADVRRGLERRYADGWLLLHEVANHLGWMPSERRVGHDGHGQSKRYLDSIAVGMYRNTGYQLIGHEIKVSRADWLSELRNPQKAGAFAGLLSEFYVVAPKGVVQPGELPDGWGLLVFHPSRITVARRAVTEDPAIPRSFIASLVARAHNPKGEP